MKLWDKGFESHVNIERFTVGNDRVYDLKLAKYDIQGNKAHAQMLQKIGILSEHELADILNGLSEIEKTIQEGTFTIEDDFEDVHSKIEHELTRKIGEAGKKIHTARSRNDQVLLDLQLYFKDEINQIKELVKELFATLLLLSDKHKNELMPGYTHFQLAMPSSFGLWFSAYAESLIDDIRSLNLAYKISDQNPLGSAAGYGTSFPIDRAMTTSLLEFETMKFNVIAAQMGRGKIEKTIAFALSSVAATLSKMSSDVCIFMNQGFNFLGFAKEFTTGSSIMPHKQNPDVFELIRAKSNKIQSLPMEIMLITNNLPSGYHRDYQILKASIMDAIEQLKEVLALSNFMINKLEIKKDILSKKEYDNLFSVEEVNKLVMKGIPFREAYKIVGKDIMEGNFKPQKLINHTHQGSIGNLCLQEIQSKFDAAFEPK
jgi:argininosuccinate lyase